MALTRHSVRTCFLWKDRGDEFGPGARLPRLWKEFVDCLEKIQTPDESGPSGVDASVRTFLESLLAAADDSQKVQQFMDRLRVARSMADVLEDWKGGPSYETGAPLALFRNPMDQGATAFFLGQLAFIFGRLRLAKAYSVEAYLLLQKAGATQKGKFKPLCLRILEFLTVTLLLEVSFHSEGYDTLRDKHGVPQTRRILIELNRQEGYLRDFPTLSDLDIEVRNGGPKGAQGLVEYFWLPIPRDKDKEPLELGPDLETLPPLSLAYVLSRWNRAGMLFFRYRDWRKAEEKFSKVADMIRKQRAESRWAPVLAPLEHEAELYLGRLRAQAYDFEEAERFIGKAQDYFELIQDEFAVNKAVKARAELAFHRSQWPEAERLFRQVLQVSRDRGYGHDEAAAEMFLGKIKSLFGFQREAIDHFATANLHFRKYDVLRETVSCLFWQTAAEARLLDLSGHPRSSVVEARALMKVYRRLFEGRPGDDRQAELPQGFLRLQEALRDKRKPDVNEVMLDLRLGRMPAPELVQRLEDLANAQEEPAWPQTAHARLIRQLLRITRLQSLDRPWPADLVAQHALSSDYEEKRLRRLCIRDHILSALEGVVWSHHAPRPYLPSSCLALQAALRQTRDLGLGGGLIPFLVDLSQFFVDRDFFIALLLLILDALHQTILDPAAVAEQHLDRENLKAVYRDLTKYLVLERNFYLGPPVFASAKNKEFWADLLSLHGPKNWKKEHEWALQGRHGINYPSVMVGFGWVETVGAGGARLQITWVDDVADPRSLRREDFQPLEVPEEIVQRGHAAVPDALIVLLGREGPDDEDSRRRPWTAHRIPLDIPRKSLFRPLEEPPWSEPVLETWQSLFQRFTGPLPVTCDSPEVEAAEVEARYAELARKWFSDRLSSAEFERVFRIPLKRPAKRGVIATFIQNLKAKPGSPPPSPATLGDPALLAVVSHFPHVKGGPPLPPPSPSPPNAPPI